MTYLRDIFNAFDADVIKYLPAKNPPAEISSTRQFVERAMKQFEQETDVNFVILEDGEIDLIQPAKKILVN